MKHQKNDPFRVMETFATIQGEGTDMGRETIFMRLYGCNLSCVWCDTAHSWDEGKYFEGIYKELNTADIVLLVREMAEAAGINHMVITGGEPLLHNHEALTNIIGTLNMMDAIKHVTFETNGTIIPHTELAKVTGLFSVSPKLSSSQNVPYNPKLFSRWLDKAYDKVQFKFVVANQEDANEVAELFVLSGDPRLKQVPIIFQPEESAGNYNELPQLINQAFRDLKLEKTEFNIRFIPQVHKLYGIR